MWNWLKKKETELDKVREKASKTLDEALDQYSLLGDEEGKKAEGLAALYKEVCADENNRKNNVLGVVGQVVVGAGSIAIAVANLWMFKRSTEKEEAGEIYDTTTKRTTVNNGLMGRFFK
jgi:F0F1-type ATP synthase membrane subunit b/b'